jgi:hypothetical protein
VEIPSQQIYQDLQAADRQEYHQTWSVFRSCSGSRTRLEQVFEVPSRSDGFRL